MIKFLDLQKTTQLHGEEINEAVRKVTASGWYLQGEETRLFEEEYAHFIGTNHCIGVANGLDALTLIYRAYIELGLLRPGDEVLVPANTFIASVLAITENGLVPVLVEPRPDTLEIDDRLIEQAITPRTRSLLLVHLYGRCAYIAHIGALCREHGLLLVEDNMINMEIANMILTENGFTVETAENGKIALDKVASSEPGYYDAILMDIQMPVMDGYEATREIRALNNKELADIPILAMTANAFKEDELAAKEAGMQAHIAKPVDVEQLLKTLAAVLRTEETE